MINYYDNVISMERKYGPRKHQNPALAIYDAANNSYAVTFLAILITLQAYLWLVQSLAQSLI